MRMKLGSAIFFAVAVTACGNRTDQTVTARPNDSRDQIASSSPAGTSGQNSSAVPAANVTMVGCVQPSDQGQKPSKTVQTDKSGNTATVEMADTKYMLTHAAPMAPGETIGTSGSTTPSPSDSGASSSSKRSGSVTTPDAPSIGSTYRLEGQNGDASLESEVGHRVQVTAVEEMPPSGSPASVMPKLKVSEIKMIAAQCQ